MPDGQMRVTGSPSCSQFHTALEKESANHIAVAANIPGDKDLLKMELGSSKSF